MRPQELEQYATSMPVCHRQVAERLVHNLEEDCLIWYNDQGYTASTPTPAKKGEGFPRVAFPDFVILHPRRGLLVLEVKDYRIFTVKAFGRRYWEIVIPNRGPSFVLNPLGQARAYAQRIVMAMLRDPLLVRPHYNRNHYQINGGGCDWILAFPWTFGVVLPNMSRHTFEKRGMDRVMASSRVICEDDVMNPNPAVFESKLWGMFPPSNLVVNGAGALSQSQLERVSQMLDNRVIAC